MKVICSKENLLEGINIVQKAVSSKTTLPLLEGILMEASDSFKLTGNDLEIGIESIVEADIKTIGSIVISSKIIGEIARKLPDSEVLIHVKENNLVIIECENSHFEVMGLPADGYPALPKIERKNGFEIKQRIVRDMIKQTVFAVSNDETRPALMGSLIECKEGDLTFVAIDGFRMALRKNAVENKSADLRVIIPGKTLNEVVKLLQPVDENMTIYISNNQILFDFHTSKVTSRLLEGEYINYKNIIPEDYVTKAVVYTKQLLLSIERASLITVEEKKYPVKMSVRDDKIVLTSNTEVGAVREEIRTEMEGNILEIGFNPRYLMDALKIIEDERVIINFTSDVGPCTIKPLSGDNYIYLVLPIRTRG
jgi:DNA polymerase-3 subunit beta